MCGAAAAAVVSCNALLFIDDIEFRDAGGGGATATGAGRGGEAGSGGSTTTSTGGAAAGGSGGAAGSAGAGGSPPLGLQDDFERPDGADLGNGWVEKLPAVYSLSGGQVVKQTTTTSYRDNMVYRSPMEDVLDLEISIEFSTTADPADYPQIFVRGQSGSIDTPNAYDGYLLYVAGSSSAAVLGRQRGSVFVVTLEPITISPPLNTTDLFRLRLSAQGTDPVQLAAYVEVFGSGGWQVIGSATHDDSAAERIDSVGTWGFAGNEPDTFVYDNFVMTPL